MSAWQIKDKRFVAFFDILGFKDLVLKTSHDSVLSKLNTLKESIKFLESIDETNFPEMDVFKDQTKSVTFSDSIIIFSKGNAKSDVHKILADAHFLLDTALEAKIPIKAAISYGEITADFENSFFFGQPIIDAFLLHEDLKQLSVILDHESVNQIRNLEIAPSITHLLTDFKVHLVYGRATHTILGKAQSQTWDERIDTVKKLYETVSGKPRTYIDNTIDFLETMKNNAK